MPVQQPAQQEVRIPNIYYTPDNNYEQKSLTETVKQFDMMGMVTNWLEHPLLSLGMATGAFFGFDLLAKKFGGEYEKSLLGKAVNLGDRIQNSKFIQSEGSQKVLKPVNKFWNKTKTWLHKNKVTSAMLDTPARPEWEMAAQELHSQQMRNVDSFKGFLNKLKLNSEELVRKHHLAIDKTDRAAAKSFFGVSKLSEVADDKLVNFIQLNRLEVPESEIKSILSSSNASRAVKDKILSKMGLTTAQIETILKDTTGETAPIIEKAMGKVKDKVRVGAGNISWWGRFQPFERTIGGSQYFNRFHAQSAAKTATGRAMAKGMQIVHRMATFGGGKLGVLMFIVPELVRTIINTKKADKKEKVGTLANGILMSGMWVVTIPLAVKALFAAGGLQHIGMSKENVKKYMDLVDEFNTKLKEGKFATPQEADDARKKVKQQVKELKKVKDQNLLTKGLRKLGSFIDIGNGSPKGRTILQKIPRIGKNAVGVPLRFIAGMALSGFVLDGAIEKACAAIFGKKYDETKEEEQKEAKKAQKQFLKTDLQERLYEAQRRKLEAAQNQPQPEPLKEQALPKVPPIEKNIEQAPIKPQSANIQQSEVQEIAQPQPLPVENRQQTEKKSEEQPQVQPQKLQQDEKQAKQVVQPIVTNKTAETSVVQKIEQKQPTIQNRLQRDNYTYIPSSENVIKPPAKDEKTESKYIPSQLGAKFNKTYDNSGLEAALKRADRAEARALDVLSGNFDNM